MTNTTNTENTKYTKYYNSDIDKCLTKSEWFAWFNENGNHDFDGWEDPESWFFDMLRGGFFSEVHETIEHKVTAFYHRVDENSNGYIETVEETETIYIFKHNENEFSFYCDKSGTNGCGTYEEIMEEISMYNEEN